jgi:hypothetical protein
MLCRRAYGGEISGLLSAGHHPSPVLLVFLATWLRYGCVEARERRSENGEKWCSRVQALSKNMSTVGSRAVALGRRA